jgi:hypothetical protein
MVELIQVLAYVLPLLLAGVGFYATVVKCAEDDDGKTPFHKRLTPAGRKVFVLIVLVQPEVEWHGWR